MTRTYDRDGTGTQPGHRPSLAQAQGSGSPEHALLMRYLAHVEKARQYEADALAQLRAGLAELAAPRSARTQRGYALPPVSGDFEPVRQQRSRSRPKTRKRFLPAFVLLTVVASAWFIFGGNDETAARKANPHAGHDMSKMNGGASEPIRLAPSDTIPVELGEFFIKTKYNKVRSGSVTFEIGNNGAAEHEFMVASLDDLPQNAVEQLSSDEVHEKVLASQHGIVAGASDEEVVLDLEPGKYLLFCNLPGHFSQGQYTVLRVA